MRKRSKKRQKGNSMQHARIEPTFGQPNEAPAKAHSTKPGEIRVISVAEYKKQIEAARKGVPNPQDMQEQDDEEDEEGEQRRPFWKKLGNGMVWTLFICANIALAYFEIQPKTLKPTFYIGTPWGTAEILTPWGKLDEHNKVAQLSAGSLSPSIQSHASEKLDNATNESRTGNENVGFYDSFGK